MMQTNREAAAATTFSRVSAAPPPLIRAPSAVASSAPSMYRARSPAVLRSSSSIPAARSFSEVWRELETAPESCILRSLQRFDELVDRGAGADTEHHAGFDVGERGFRGAAFFFQLTRDIPIPRNNCARLRGHS